MKDLKITVKVIYIKRDFKGQINKLVSIYLMWHLGLKCSIYPRRRDKNNLLKTAFVTNANLKPFPVVLQYTSVQQPLIKLRH